MYIYIVVGLGLIISGIFNPKKTRTALKIAVKRFTHIIPAFLTMIVLVSIILFLAPSELISSYLSGNNKFVGLILASLIGSITFMPGFIVFPLGGLLLKEGISYMVIATFTTTLMMVGVITAPIEKAYFGMKVTIIRNSLGFLIALTISLMIGIFFGELF